MKKAINTVTILLFLAVITLPLLMFHHEKGRISIIENKTVASRPEFFAYEGLLDRRLPSDWDTYFTDNIGLKDEAILFNIAAKYTLFNDIDIKDYTMGKQGHLFYLTQPILETYQGLDEPSAEILQTICESICTLDSAVQESGAKFFFMPIPNKEAIYPEFMPSDIHVISENPMLHSVTEKLKADTNVNVVDVESVLLEHKEDGELLYYRNIDPTHWNPYGAFCGYQALMKQIHTLDSEIHVLSIDEVTIEAREVQRAFLYLQSYPIIQDTFSNLSDVDYAIAMTSGWMGHSDNSKPMGFSLAGDTKNQYFYYHNDILENGKTLMVFGDSYIYTFMLPLLSESFENVYFLNTDSTPNQIFELLQYVQPDFIVFESVARMLSAERLSQLVTNLTSAIDAEGELEAHASVPIMEGQWCNIRFDDFTLDENHCLSVSRFNQDGTVVLSGWAANPEYTGPVGDIYVKVGERYFLASATKRTDLDETLLDAGFTVSIHAGLLEELASIQIIAMTLDGTERYMPLPIELMA